MKVIAAAVSISILMAVMSECMAWRVTSKERRSGAIVLTLVAALGGAVRGDAQIQYSRGQNAAPVFEGWEQNADGSFNFVFGYMNRNYEEVLNIPIGPDNNIQPGGPDRGQPTHFYPRRTQSLFKVTVPKEWDRNQRLVWTLTAHGRTDTAKAWLQPEWQIDDGSKTRAGEPNAPPSITGSGPQTITWPARTLSLTATATDDGVRKPRRREPPATPTTGAGNPTGVVAPPPDGGPPRGGLTVKWIQYRGPGHVTFRPAEAQPSADGKPVVTLDTTATFSTPGTYLLWAIARDGLMSTVHAVTVTVNPGA